MTTPAIQTMCTQLGDRLRRDEPLSRHTSFRIGGPADYFIDAASLDDIRSAQQLAAALDLRLWVLGGGTNVLVSDRGVRGVVVHLGRHLAFAEWQPNGVGTKIRAGAALTFKKLVRETIDRGLAGLEFAEGIPGSVGGGLLMNAGAFGGEISTVVQFVEGIGPDGTLRSFAREQLRFSYRNFDLPQGLVVTSVGFLLQAEDPAAIRARFEDAKRKRESRQPVGFPNAGSVFKNPPGHFAGRLIESVGLKGHRLGNAMISPQHANFIVNAGGASAADVRGLMAEAQRRVRAAVGVELEPEIKLVGEWEPR